MAIAWVRKTGTWTPASPYSTYDTAAATIAIAMTYLATQDGPHTLYIVAGEYTEGISITSQTNLAGMQIIGLNSSDTDDYASKDSVVLNYASAHVVRIEQPDIQVIGLTPKNTGANYDGYYLNADGLRLDQCYGIDMGRRFIWSTASATNLRVSRSIFEGCDNTCVRNYSPSSLFDHIIFRPSTSKMLAESGITAFESYNASGTSRYSNIIVVGTSNRAFQQNGAGECIVANSILQCGDGPNGASVIIRSTGTVKVRSCKLIPNWKAPTAIFEGTITEDVGNIIVSGAEFNSPSRQGYIIPSVDDTGGWEYAIDVAEVLRRYNASGTFYVNTLNLDSYVDEVLSVEEAGFELGFHASTNTQQNVTGDIYSITSTGGTIAVDRDSDTITVTGSGAIVISGFRSKKLSTIKSELESAGCTVGDVPTTMDDDIAGECMSDSSGAQSSPYTPQVLVDITAQTGLFKTELVDALAKFESLLGRSPVAFATPRGATSEDARTAAKSAGLLCSRNSYNGYGADWGLSSLNIYNLAYIGYGQVCGTTLAETKRNTRFLCEMIATTGGIISIVGHNTSEIDMAEWDAIIGVISEYSAITIEPLGTIVNRIRNGAPWSTSDEITYTRASWDDVADYTSSSTLTPGAGSSIFVNGDGDVYDLNGIKVWDDTPDANTGLWANGPTIGPYAVSAAYFRGPWASFNGTMPTLTRGASSLLVVDGAQVWSKLPTDAELAKAFGGV